MTRLLRRLIGRSAFYLNVYLLMVGTIASQVVLFAASVVLARLYPPHEFGQFSIALSVSTVLVVLATMRLEAAVPLADDDRDAATITLTALMCSGVAAFVLTALLVLQTVLTGHPWSAFGAGSSVWLVPPMVGALGAWTSLRMLQSRMGNFSAISISSVTSAVVQSVVQLALGGLRVGAVGLSVGYISGRVWNAVSLLRGAKLVDVWSPTAYFGVIKNRFRFCLMTMVPSVLNTVSVTAVVPFVALLYGVAFSGMFALSARVLALPSALLGQAVSTVFYPKAAEAERSGRDLAQPIQNATTGLFRLSVPAFGVVTLLGPELFGFIFGEPWRAAGTISAALAPWLAASLVSSPLSGLMTVKNQQRRLLVMSIAETSMRLISLSLGVVNSRPMLGVAAYSLSGAAISAYYVGWSLRLAGSGLLDWARSQRVYICAVAVVYPLLLTAKSHTPLWVFFSMTTALTVVMLGWAVSWVRRAGYTGRL